MELTVTRKGGLARLRSVMVSLFIGMLSLLAADAAHATVSASVSPPSANLCSGASQTFTASYTTSGCEGTAGSPAYTWFLDNNVVSGQTTSQYTTSFSAGSHTVKCTVSVTNCGSGTSAASAITVTAGGLTVNSASASPASATTCSQVSYSGSASESCGSGNISYSWDFGDGVTSSPSTSASATHTYASAGTYTPVLHATDGSNSATLAAAAVTVTASSFTVTASATPTSATTCEAVDFEGSASGSCSGTVTYSWNFGDGSAATAYSTSASASHTYTSAGTFSAVLTATDGTHTGTATATVTASAPSTPGQVTGLTVTVVSAHEEDLAWNPVSGAAGYDVFRSGGGGSYTQIGTTLSNSYQDTTASPSTAYSYEVSAYACAGGGGGQGPIGPPSSPVTGTTPCDDQITQTVQGTQGPVFPGQAVTYSATVTETCPGSPVTTWASSAGNKTGSSVTYTFTQPQNYDFSVTTSDNLATSPAYLFTQIVWDYSLTASLPTVIQGTTSTGLITLNSLNGYNGTVTVTASSAPSGVVFSLIDNNAPNPCPDVLSGGSSVTVQVPDTITVQVCAEPAAAVGTYTITFTGTSQDGDSDHTATATLTIAQATGSAGPASNALMASLGSLVNPGTLLDAVGNLAHPSIPEPVDDWRQLLHRGVTPVSVSDRQAAANAHLWLGEYRLAHDEQPDDAIWHFRQAQKLCQPKDSLFGRAAYDTAIALYYDRAYQASTDTFRTLLDARTMLPGYDRRQCALWYRIARAHAAYHAQRAALGIPESPKLDSFCAAASLAVSLRSLGLPSDRGTLAQACRVTGEGSDILDVIAAGKHLGVTVRTVTADDAGLMALPKPVIAHVEHDHFVSVAAADKAGVTILCSDMGSWPGCRVHLTWRQWHAMEADVYATVTAPGSTWDRALAMALSPGSSQGVRVASAGPVAGLESAATRRVLAAAGLLHGGHIETQTATHSIACGSKPSSPRTPGQHPKNGDPVDLATGEEDYSPPPDLVVYNPNGPPVVWSRSYESYLGPGPANEPNDFGVGWTQPYNVGVYDPGYNNPTGSATYTPPTGSKYIYLADGTQLAFTAASVPSASNPVVVCTPQQLGLGVRLEWHYDAGNPSGYYVIVGKDRSKMTTANITAATGCYVLSTTQDSLGNGLKFNYTVPAAVVTGGSPITTPSLCGWPVLNSIADLNSNQTLLTIARGANRTISSVTDAYGRSVFYHVTGYANTGVPCAYPQVSLELDQVSYVVPSTATNPANRYVYGYQNYTNLDGQETTPYLHTVQRPAPSGSGTSVLTINYDSNLACVSSVVDANGNQNVYTDASGGAFQNATTVTTKDAGGNVLNAFTVSMDTNFMELTRTDGAGRTIHTLAYTDVNDPYAPSTVTDGTGHTWTYHYDTNGDGNLTSVVDPRGDTTTYTYAYDATNYPLGELQSVQETNGASSKAPVSFTYYEPSGLIQTATTANPDTRSTTPVTTTYTYSSLGNVLTVTTAPYNDAAGSSVTTFNYTSDPGDSAHSVPSYSQSEAIGEPLTVTDNLGHVSHLRYDGQGDRTAVYDALGHETDFSYVDTAHSSINIGQIQSVSYPASGETGTGHSKTTYAYGFEGGPAIGASLYDESGNLARQTSYSLGLEGETLGVSGGMLPVTYTYDALYRPATVADGNGNVTHYYYDLAGYPDAVTYPGYAGPTPVYNAATGSYDNITGADSLRYPSYDADGKLLASIDGNGVETDYTYGGTDGELSLIHYPGGQLADRTYSYDAAFGRLIGVTDGVSSRTYAYDSLDDLTSETTSYTGGPQNLTLGYLFYPDGSTRQMTTPGGNFSYGYDGAGRLSSLTNPYSEATGWTYLDNDWPSTQTVYTSPSSTAYYLSTTLTLDALGHTTGLSTTSYGPGYTTPLTSYSAFSYDGSGQETGRSGSVYGDSYNGARSFAYDSGHTGTSALGQVTGESFPGSLNLSYTYDAAGNATQITSPGSPIVGLSGTYNADNQQIVARGLYDGNGNIQRIGDDVYNFTWDAENNLTEELGGSATFTAGYMDDGRRAWKAASGTKTYFLYDGATPVCEFDASGNVTAVNTFGSGLISRHTTSDTFYTFDPQGNVVQRMGSGGIPTSIQDYTAFGQTVSSFGPTTQPDPFGYHGSEGYYTDRETGLLYLTHRYYDPTRARFLNRDPIGYGGGINLYGYCGNGPVEGSDPLGLADDGNSNVQDLTDPDNTNDNQFQSELQFRDPVMNKAGRDAASAILHSVPGVGTVAGVTDAATGCDYLSGEQLGTTDRIINGVGSGLSLVGGGELEEEIAEVNIIKRGGGFRKAAREAAHDLAPINADGEKFCEGCGASLEGTITVETKNGPIETVAYDYDHFPDTWEQRVRTMNELPERPSRKYQLDEYNRDLRLLCPSCNRGHRIEGVRGPFWPGE